MSTRATNARHVRQRKLNTKQPLRITRENQIEEALDDESQRHIPQVETGVEKGEEVEFHLQAVITAASAAARGIKTQENYIPTPEVVKAKDVNYDQLYPETFREPATYIRFSSTVEDCVGAQYCMNEEDAEFLANLNDGKDVNGQPTTDKGSQCSEDTFEEVMSFFEATSQRVQPYATVDSPPLLSLDEMKQAREEGLSSDALKFLELIYQHWVLRKGTRPLMPSIKVRVLDTTNEADDTDPYVCFRRREVRQTRKTRGRDAQVVEKLKKLRLELEQARLLVQMVKSREELNKQNLEVSRKVFEQRRQLKEVKIAKNIIGEKGDDEDLLVNQKPAPKPKTRQESAQPARPTTIRIQSISSQRAPENDLVALADLQAEADTQVSHTIEARKEQHKWWNHHWQDMTWDPITPPSEVADQPIKWAPLFPEGAQLPTPPPSLPSRTSQDRDGDVDMADQKPAPEDHAARDSEQDAKAGAESHSLTFFVPPPYLMDDDHSSVQDNIKRDGNPACRLRYGRGGLWHLEMRKQKRRAVISRGVVSDSESDEEVDDYYPSPERMRFEYRSALNNRARPEGMTGERRQWQSGDQTAMMSSAQAGAGQQAQQQTQPQLAQMTAGSPS